MKIARHSFVPPIKDVTAASQGVNSKWGLALPSSVRSHNDLYFPCFLLPPHPPPLSSVSLYSWRRAPCDGFVLTGLSHWDATRGKLMCPRLCRSITPCDGTSASALSGIHRTGCGKKKKRPRGLHKEFLDNNCCSVGELWCACVTALGLRLRSLVCR